MVTNANMIRLSGDYVHEEYTASEAITPGHLCELHTSTTLKVKKHSVAAGFSEKMFAVEDALQGDTIDDAYAAAALVPVNIFSSGAKVQAWLKAAENVVAGDKLMSAGDGTLKKNTGTVLQTIGTALEALNLSASGAVATRIDIQIV